MKKMKFMRQICQMCILIFLLHIFNSRTELTLVSQAELILKDGSKKSPTKSILEITQNSTHQANNKDRIGGEGGGD